MAVGSWRHFGTSTEPHGLRVGRKDFQASLLADRHHSQKVLLLRQTARAGLFLRHHPRFLPASQGAYLLSHPVQPDRGCGQCFHPRLKLDIVGFVIGKGWRDGYEWAVRPSDRSSLPQVEARPAAAARWKFSALLLQKPARAGAAWEPILTSVLLLGAGFLLLSLAAPIAAKAEAGVMTYIHNAPESDKDVRYVFHWTILKTALERTKEKWGAYQVQPSPPMTEARQTFELQHATGRLTIMYLSPTPVLEKTLIPIRIPVDKNLSGYFVFLIRKENQARLDAIKGLEDLRQLDVGLGHGWVDVPIMQSQGFKVVTGSSYDGLFEMLIARRFTIFPRSGVEIIGEYEQHRQQMPELQIEEHLLLYYPLPMYFWFAQTPEGKRLADRAEAGMRIMIADGTYDRIFDDFFRKNIERLRLNQRKMFALENPNLGPETPFSDKKLWFDPASYK